MQLLSRVHRRTPRKPRKPRQAGFTLVELMISLVLFSFAIAGILSIAVTVVTGFREQRIAINTEGAARMSMEFLADAVRGAAPGVKNETQLEDVTSTTCAKGGFAVVNSTSAPDQLILTYPSGGVLTSLRTAVTKTTTAVTLTDATQLSVGDRLLITNTEVGHIVKVSAVNTGTGAVTLVPQACSPTLWPGGDYPPGSLVIRVDRAQFYVADLDGIPTLWMNPTPGCSTCGEPLAEGIEDFQIALAADTNGDNTIAETTNGAGDEWYGNAAGETLPVNSVVRGVRIWMIARATKPIANGAYQRPIVGDRATAGATDAYRRRLLTSTVEIRNNELSP